MNTVHVIAVGAFGMEVANMLKNKMEEVVITQLDEEGRVYPAYWPHARIHVVASWRPVSSLCQLIDKICFAWKKPWVQIVMDHTSLIVGPVVVPGQEGCYTCFSKRQIQHSTFGKYIQQSQEAYKQNFRLGPKGFLRTHVGMAANLFLHLDHHLQENLIKEAGSVYECNVIRSSTRKGKVVGFHGCPHCGLQRDESTRSYDYLLEKYDEIFIRV
ncbi:TOMM precursor leader peptide-binding protein [Brevibacillus laterosporus]|uniref:TOMM precursor leader peptide-binding protein n=1 Tax=Brevibacillus laterosporus TaxID=1465 RepID=UPI003D1CEE25